MPPVPLVAFHFDVAAAVHQADQSVRHIGGLLFVYLEAAAVVALEIGLLSMVDMLVTLVIGLIAAGGASLLVHLVVVRCTRLGASPQKCGFAEGVHHRTGGLVVPNKAGIVAETLVPVTFAGGSGDCDSLSLAA